MSGEKPKGVLENLPQLIEKMKKANAEGPGPRQTDEEVERMAAQVHDIMLATRTRIDAIRAKGGRKARVEAAMALADGVYEMMKSAGVDIPPPPDLSSGERPALERNGRKVVIDILDDATLRDGPIEVLVERYLDTAVAAHDAIQHGRVARHNRLSGRLWKIGKALKARVPDGRTALLPFLRSASRHSFPVASTCREIAPEQAAAALASIQPR